MYRQFTFASLISFTAAVGTMHPPNACAVVEEQAKLTASDAFPDTQFGSFTALSGNTALVGAFRDDEVGEDSGAAYIYERTGDTWTEQQKLLASNPQFGEEFGRSGGLDGDTAIIGAHLSDARAGSAYIFQPNGSTWTEQARLVASDAQAGDEFGRSTAISGETAIAGAFRHNAQAGAAYIFQSGMGGTGNWGEVVKLTASDGEAGDRFGRAVSISGDTALIGAPNDETGSAYIFERDRGGAGNWGEVAKILASDGETGHMFGSTAAVSGDIAIVGSVFDDHAGEEAGSAYIFQRDHGGLDNWGQVAKLTASDAAPGQRFGISVALDGDVALVGAFFDEHAGGRSGAAYVFQRNLGGTDNWGELAKVTATDAEADDFFGFSTAVSGDTLLIGAINDDDAGSSSGSAYAFVIRGSEELPGDYNGNGRVEQADLDLVLLNWGQPFDMLPDDWIHERPTNGIVDQSELDGVLLNWGAAAASGASTIAAVPEPASWILVVIGALGTWYRILQGVHGWPRGAICLQRIY